MQTLYTNDGVSVAEQVKKDAHALGNEAVKMAHNDILEPTRERIIQPAASLARDAHTAIKEGVKHVQGVVHDRIDSTRKVLSDTVTQTHESAAVQRERAAIWISSNPFVAVGIAALTGAVLALISHHRHN